MIALRRNNASRIGPWRSKMEIMNGIRVELKKIEDELQSKEDKIHFLKGEVSRLNARLKAIDKAIGKLKDG